MINIFKHSTKTITPYSNSSSSYVHIRLFLLLSFLVSCCLAYTQTGIVNSQGEIIVPFEYKSIAYAVNDSIFSAKRLDDKAGFIDATGKIKIPFVYDFCSQFLGETTVVSKDGKSGVIDRAGNLIIPFEYNRIIRNESSKYFSYWNEFRKQGIIDNKNRIVVNPEFHAITLLDDVYFRGVKGSRVKFYYISSGQEVIDEVFKSITKINDNVFAAKKSLGLFKLLNRKGETISDENIMNFKANQANKRIYIKDGNSSFYVIDETGRKIYEPDENLYTQSSMYNNGYIIASSQKGGYGIMTDTGELLVDFQYDSVLEIDTTGNFWAEKDRKYGLMHISGTQIRPFKYTLVRTVHNGMTIYKSATDKGLIDKEGNEIPLPDNFIPDDFFKLSVGTAGEGRIVLWKEGKVGVLNNKGEVIIPFEYEGSRYSGLTTEGIWLQKDGKFGFVDWGNEVLLPFIFNKKPKVLKNGTFIVSVDNIEVLKFLNK